MLKLDDGMILGSETKDEYYPFHMVMILSVVVCLNILELSLLTIRYHS